MINGDRDTAAIEMEEAEQSPELGSPNSHATFPMRLDEITHVREQT